MQHNTAHVEMPISAVKTLQSMWVALCWVGFVPDHFNNSRNLLTSANEIKNMQPSQTDINSPPKSGGPLYEGLFALPADGADPFDGVSILRANAIALKRSHVSDEVLESMAQLIQELIHEEAHNIQHQTDLWLVSQTKSAVDTLHTNPAVFPATGYSLQEGSNGVLYVKVSIRIRIFFLLASQHKKSSSRQTFPTGWWMQKQLSRSWCRT